MQEITELPSLTNLPSAVTGATETVIAEVVPLYCCPKCGAVFAPIIAGELRIRTDSGNVITTDSRTKVSISCGCGKHFTWHPKSRRTFGVKTGTRMKATIVITVCSQ